MTRPVAPRDATTWIRWPGDGAPVTEIGGKAFGLAELGRAGFDVPEWFAVASGAEGQDGDTLAGEIAHAVAALAPASASASSSADVRFAVRSSAVDEDGTGHSFAGQLESYLDVPAADVLARVRDVWASGNAERVVAYRRERKLEGAPVSPGVIVQRMMRPEAAGVAFSADPVSGRRSVAVVAAVPGLGDALVSGDVDADAYEISREGVVTLKTLRAGGGAAALTHEQVAAVARLARDAAHHVGRPQDIEWAIEGGRLRLLQSRAITTLTGLADPDGGRRIWDNSNIAESYGGITTPLTFSFARGVYAEVYRQFCVILSVPRSLVDDQRSTFENMLGLVRGRVYYNLISWYRVLAMLPGFSVNRGFMEQMMGVREPMPDEVLAGERPPTRWARWVDGARLVRSMFGLMASLVRLPRQIDRFYLRLNAALGSRADVSDLRLDELTAHYRSLERQLLTRWDAPLVNDFFAMIFYGVLRALCTKWCGDADGSLQNDLISGEGGIVSAEPARLVQELAHLVARNDALTTALATASVEVMHEALARESSHDVKRAYDDYLAKFSDRCLDELKLESPTLADEPMMLLRTIGRLALAERVRQAAAVPANGPALPAAGATATPPSTPPSTPQPPTDGPRVTGDTGPAPTPRREGAEARVPTALRVRAEARVATALAWKPVRRFVFGWVLRQARLRVRHRENLRFERTRVFGRVRRIFVEAGKRLVAEGRLERADDVFYLQVDEVLGFVEGTVTTANLGALAEARRREFDGYRALDAPSDRFDTRGAVWVGNRFQQTRVVATLGDDERRGIGCCPGVVEGRARVITDPRGASLEPGDILVAERTDPGWILLFPSALAVVVERGSVLSHSAIVARELGLPAVVSLPGLTSWLRDGDWISVDGTSGVVRRAASPNASASTGTSAGTTASPSTSPSPGPSPSVSPS